MAEALRELSGAWNFRDVADGTARLRPGRLFRSGELSRLDDDGRATLLALGITDVADLRATREVARRGPGLVPDGIDVHLLPFPDLGDDEPTEAEAPHESAFRKLFEGEVGEAEESGESPAEAAGRYMADEYRQSQRATAHNARCIASSLCWARGARYSRIASRARIAPVS